MTEYSHSKQGDAPFTAVVQTISQEAWLCEAQRILESIEIYEANKDETEGDKKKSDLKEIKATADSGWEIFQTLFSKSFKRDQLIKRGFPMIEDATKKLLSSNISLFKQPFKFGAQIQLSCQESKEFSKQLKSETTSGNSMGTLWPLILSLKLVRLIHYSL